MIPDEKQRPDRSARAGRNRLREQERRAGRRRTCLAALACLAVALLAAPLLGRMLLLPRSARHTVVKVAVRTGTEGADLERAGVVRSGFAFDLLARWRGDAGRLKPGLYTLAPDMTPQQILRQLRLGPGHAPDDRVILVIPEGFTLRQIAARLEREHIADGAAFLRLASRPDVRGAWPYDFPRPPGALEGYLCPDSYSFFPGTPPEKVLEALLLNFSRRFSRPYHTQIGASGESLHEIVTKASLIEREARVPQDRQRIAGVIENRLKRGMKLEIDATVLYALGRHKRRVFYKDLLVKSPYNTYRHAGLPPGPIASPGVSAFTAALNPERHDYLYYVARPDGSHYFTRTAKEHEVAVRQAREEWKQASDVETDTVGRADRTN